MACSESRYSIRACYTRHYVGRYLYYARMVALRLLVAWVRLPATLHAYVSDNYSNASQIGTGFFLIRTDEIRIVPCEFLEELLEKKNRKEREEAGSGRIESVVANKVVLSRESRGKWRLIVERFPWIRQETRYDTDRSSNLAALVIQIEQCAFFFSFSFLFSPSANLRC